MSATPHGTVDVIIAARDAALTVGDAVRSALAQPEAARVIVVDDASGDDTTMAAHAADDGTGRLLVIRLTANAGPSAARNRAIAHGAAEWLTVLDADDRMLAGRLGRLLSHAAEATLIADDLLVVTAGDAGPARPMFLPAVATPRLLDARAFIAGNISHGARTRRDLGFIKPLVSRALLDRLGARFREELRLGEDYALYAELLLGGGRLLLVPACGYVYTVRPTSLSGAHGIEDLRRFRDADHALLALPGLREAERAIVRRHYRSVDCRLQWRLLIAAAKGRDLREGLRIFVRSPRTSWFLLGQLRGEAARRLAGRLRQRAPA